MNRTNILRGKIALVTGGSQGLGAEIARHFIAAGASVVLCARTKSDLMKTKDALAALCDADQKVHAIVADIGREADVDKLVAEIFSIVPHLDILVNNAGIYGPMGALEDVSWQDWVAAIQINLIGNIYLTRCLIPHMKAQKQGKILFLSGGGATSPLPGISAYAASKAAIVRMTETLALELQDHGIDVNAVAPGAMTTRLIDQLLEAGEAKVGRAMYDKMVKIKAEGGTPLEKGAALCTYLASRQSNGITGKLISAPWDHWETLHTHRDELNSSDIYSLRRIMPEDRGKKWDEK